MNTGDAIKILEIANPVSLTLESLKVIYRDLANIWHPDRHQSNPRIRGRAEKKFKEIVEAYETLLLHLQKVDDLKKQVDAKSSELKKAENDLFTLQKHKKVIVNHTRKIENKINTATQTLNNVYSCIQDLKHELENMEFSASGSPPIIEPPPKPPVIWIERLECLLKHYKMRYVAFIAFCFFILASRLGADSLYTFLIVIFYILPIAIVPWIVKLILENLRRKKLRTHHNVL